MKTHLPRSRPHWLESWHVDPSANREYDFIDGLRGLAILMVLACHHLYFNPQSGAAVRFVGNVFGAMGVGVSLFFTISGFLIAWPFWKRKVNRTKILIPPGYGWRRFWKIYPPLALSVLLLTPTYILWKNDAPLYFQTAGQWLTGWALLTPVSGKFNPVMWSLVVEVHFYLVIPLLFLLTKTFSPKKTLWLISFFFLVAPVTTRFLTGLTPSFYPQINDPFPTGLDAFCLGVWLAGIDNLKLWNQRWARLGDFGWFLVLAGLVGIGWSRMSPQNPAENVTHLFHGTFLLGAGCLLCYAADPQHPRAKMLCAPWLRWCGLISYEWYLFHQPLAVGARQLFGQAGGNLLKYFFIVALPLLVSTAIAALIYRRFSLPILKYGRARRSAQK